MKNIKGYTFIALSALFYSTYGLWSKFMSGAFGEFSQAWIRALMLLALLIPFGLATKRFVRIKRKDIKWFLVVGLSGGLNQAPYFFGFEHLNVGTATLIFYTMLTLGAYIIGKFFFGEKLTKSKYLSLILAVVGLAIIYPLVISTPTELLAAISTTIAGLLGASIVVFSKKLSSNYSETQILSVVFFLMFISNLIISLFVKDTIPTPAETIAWGSQFAYATAMLIANAFVIAGYKKIQPSIGGIIGLLEVVFAIILGIILLSESLSLGIAVGTLVILLSIALPLVKEYRANKTMDAPIPKVIAT